MSKNNFCGQATLCAYKIRQSVIHLNPFPGSNSINTTSTLVCFLKKQIVTNAGKGKSKAVPLQAWSGPEGSRKLRFPDFMTTAQDGGKVFSLMHQPPLPPGNTPGTHFC